MKIKLLMTTLTFLIPFCAMAMEPGCGTADTDKEANEISRDDLQRRIDDILAKHPDAEQISDNAVIWNGGSAMLSFENNMTADKNEHRINATHWHNCPSGWLCFYDFTNFVGRRLQFNSCSTQFLDIYGLNISSWVNHTSHTYRLYDSKNQRSITAPPDSSGNLSANSKISYFTCR